MTINTGVLNQSQNGNATEVQWLPSLTVDGLGDVGVFDSFTGGDTATSPQKHRPGGMGDEVSYLGLPVYSDVTISRVYDQGRDQALLSVLRGLAGSTYGTISLQPLDQNKQPWGSPRTFRGRISSLKEGNTSSNSDAVRMYEIDFVIENVAN